MPIVTFALLAAAGDFVPLQHWQGPHSGQLKVLTSNKSKARSLQCNAYTVLEGYGIFWFYSRPIGWKDSRVWSHPNDHLTVRYARVPHTHSSLLSENLLAIAIGRLFNLARLQHAKWLPFILHVLCFFHHFFLPPGLAANGPANIFNQESLIIIQCLV